MICPYCEFHNEPGSKSCKECGKNLMFNRRFAQIEEQQAILRKEKALLLRERPWYSRPGNWIGIIGILIAIVIFALSQLIGKEKKELTISYTPISPLVSFESPALSKLQINFENKPIENLWRFLIRFQNTGTKSISEEDFKDGPIYNEIKFKELYKSNELTIDYPNLNTFELPLLLDILEMDTAGQTSHILIIKNQNDPAVFTYQPSLLNKGEIVEFEVFLSTSRDFNLKTTGKIADGKIINEGQVQELSNLPLSSKDSRLAIFGIKTNPVISLVVLLILVIASISLLIFTIFGEGIFDSIVGFSFFTAILLISLFFVFRLILFFVK